LKEFIRKGWFYNADINPDRLIDKFKGKEGLFENSPFDERTRQI
jgi:hypothetical protein